MTNPAPADSLRIHHTGPGDLRVTGGVYEQEDLERLDFEVTGATEGFTRNVSLDLSDIDFLPSLAVGTLIALARRAERDGVAVTLTARAGSLAHRVLSVVGVPVGEPAGGASDLVG
ncbi:STAS domain-containing protein [Nocardioides zeae]